MGQADFDRSIEDLTGSDRARLYAYFNQKRHIDELVHAFGLMVGDPLELRKATVIDIGCGPFTAGLALAEVLTARTPFRYVGVDRANSMCALGLQLSRAAIAANALHGDTSIEFRHDLDTCDFGPDCRNGWTVVVLSYLLASGSVEVNKLVASIVSAADRIGPGPVAVIHTNSAASAANAKFAELSKALTGAEFATVVDEQEVFIHTDSSPKSLHYALFVRQRRVGLHSPKGVA
ncbi:MULTISPECIES: hypothetical protein [unclassified Variovorax]|jgi:SAM-dependent methyltransferase|uniref:hypothetical protein n=1 Tax=unclassified Variovorax TaxID=663243 RepID=UPI000D120F9F|nr:MULTISPECIES: hypothetical protein [unclassified Variovorax]AVQ82201.1 hypothetical protein C4F17_15240 [Variovorax sp. PMC12]QRY33537.1 hypothetical protein JVX96_09680 [Variovorax sp. PDNC026]